MREGTFISRNRERWEQYQQQTDNPDEQADRLIQLTDDLGYAKTFYPESKTTRYINALAACQFIHLYQNRRADYKRLWRFWQYELPLLFGRYHRIYLFTFCFFLLCVMLGVIGSIHDPELVRAVLGDDYVSMTEENIARGDPFGVYKSGHEVAMFIRIAANNIRVSLMLFSTGILAGVGSLYLLFENGIDRKSVV